MNDRIITDDAFDKNYLVWKQRQADADTEIEKTFDGWLDDHADLISNAAEVSAAGMLAQIAGVPGLNAKLSDTAVETIVLRAINTHYRLYKNLKIVHDLFHLTPELSRRQIIAAAVKGYNDNWNDQTINQLFRDLFGSHALVGKRVKRNGELVYTQKNWRPVFQLWFED